LHSYHNFTAEYDSLLEESGGGKVHSTWVQSREIPKPQHLAVRRFCLTFHFLNVPHAQGNGQTTGSVQFKNRYEVEAEYFRSALAQSVK
jgi:hypothetical protein